VKVCGLRHSRYGSQAAARLGAKLLAARVQKLSRAAPARRALRVVLHTNAATRATLTAAAATCDSRAPRPLRQPGTQVQIVGVIIHSPTTHRLSLAPSLGAAQSWECSVVQDSTGTVFRTREARLGASSVDMFNSDLARADKDSLPEALCSS
jgi:hypothetical protein